MKRIITCFLYLLTFCGGLVYASSPATLDDAKTLSASSGKPLLLKFYRED